MPVPDLRIVSLLPSATEIVCALGLQEHLVGVSHECDFPIGVEMLPRVTRTAIPKGLDSLAIDNTVRELLQTQAALYHLNEEILAELKPEFIVTQALCDVCAVSAEEVNSVACRLPGQPRVINLEPMSLAQVFETIALLGTATRRQQQADRVLQLLQGRVAAVTSRTASIPVTERPRVAMLEWIDPLFNAGHWTPELVSMAGGIDCLGNANQPSRQIAAKDLIDSNPDVVFIALCGFDMTRTAEDLPLLNKIPGWEALRCVQQGRVYYTDGNAYFSRPGPRLVDSLEILAHTLFPHLHPNLHPNLHASAAIAGKLPSN